MYSYEQERGALFTHEGQLMLLSIRDNVFRLCDEAGAVRMDKAIANEVGSSWMMLACVDRLVEIGELMELTGPGTPGQHRVFVKVLE